MKTALSIIWMYLLLFSPAVYAENLGELSISGYVTDAENGEALIGANVYMVDTDFGTATNEYGFYSLSVNPGTYELHINYLGYKTEIMFLEINNEQTLDFRLNAETLSSEEVVVTAERPDNNVSSVEMSIAQLDAKAFRQIPVVLGEIDVIKTIELLPGVSKVSEGTTGFNVRGGSAGQNLILLDEAPIYNASHLFGFFSVFNGDAINEVKLYKGGINSRYGGRLSSVLDIRQKEGNNQHFSGSLGIGLISSRFLFEGPIIKDKWSYLVAGRRSYGDLFLPLIDNNSTAYFYDLNLKSNLILDSKNRFFISGYFGRDRFELDGAFGNSWGNEALNLRWNHLFSDQIFSNFSLIYSNYDYENNFYTPGSEFNWTAGIESFKFKGAGTWYVSEYSTIEFGLQSIFYQFNPGRIAPVNNSSIQTTQLDVKQALEPSLYFSWDHKISARLEIQAGLRYSMFYNLGPGTQIQYAGNMPVVYNSTLERYENGTPVSARKYGRGEIISRYAGFEPRLNLRYQITAVDAVKASYNRTMQYIHLITNAAAPSPLDIWTPSDPFIAPQKSDQVALGYFRNFADNMYELSIEGYYKWLYNQVDYVPGADLILNNNLETELLTGTGHAYGLEIYLRKNSGRLNGWLSYTWSRTFKTVPGLGSGDPGINNGNPYPASYDKIHEISLTGIYDLNDVWSFGSNFVYATGRPITFPQSRYEYGGVILSQYEGRNLNRYPDYMRLDISATLKNKLGGDWVFSIYNLLNRRNAASIQFRQNEDAPVVTEAVRISYFGIVPSISYQYRF